MFLFFILSVIGIAIVLGVQSTDNIFSKFSANDTSSLQASMVSLVPYLIAEKNRSRQYTELALSLLCPVLTPCGVNATLPPNSGPMSIDQLPANPAWTFQCDQPQKVTGSFGTICMEETLNAATFAVQLASWNNSRGTLYFFAIVLTFFTLVLAYFVHRQKHPQAMSLNTSAPGAYPMSPPIAVHGSVLYEMFRVGWGISSFIIVFWIANLFTSYKQFADFYLSNTTGSLNAFWVDYDKKFIASVVCVGIYLCWPLVHFGIEVGLWAAFVIPWYLIRAMCKPGLETMRYDVPLDDQPGWVRLDMFFTEFNDIKRLGFSARAWELMTGTKEAFLNCCDTMGVPPGQLPPPAAPGAPTPWGASAPPPTGPPVAQTPVANRNLNTSVAQQSQDQFQMRTVPSTAASGNFQAQDSSFMQQSQVRASGTISEGEGDKKEKKEKKHKKDKSDKGTKEKKDKSDKKEKKSKEKKDKSSKEKGNDSD